MMDIKQAKQDIQANLDAGNFVLSGLDVAGTSIPHFLSNLPPVLQFTKENSMISLEDSTLKLEHTVPGNWNVSGTGITAGMLQGTKLTLDLTAGETVLEPKISLLGSLLVQGLPAMGVEGSMSDPESSLIDLLICPEHLPSVRDIASLSSTLSGIADLTGNLAQLNSALQAITAARFGFDISTAGFRYIGVDGRMCFGDSMLEVTCLFTPDLVIQGKIPRGEQIHLLDLLASLSLEQANFPQVEIADLAFSLNPASQSYSFKIALEGDWDIRLGNTPLTLSQLGAELNYAEKTVTAEMTGDVIVDEALFILKASREDTGTWKFSGGLDEESTIKLRSVINTFLPGSLELPGEVPDLECKDIALTFEPTNGAFSFQASSAEPWNIPVGVEGLNLSNINLSIDRKTEDNESKVTGNVGGTLNIGATNFTAKYDFPGDFVLSGNIPSFQLSPLVQDLCGVDSVCGISIPAGVLDIELKDIAFNIAPQKREMALSAGSDYGQAEIQVKRTASGTWGFTVGFVPPEQWKFSTIDSSLTVLDDLKFSDTALILASGDDSSFELATIDTPHKDVSIKSGLNLFSTLSMVGLGVDNLLVGVDSLTVYSVIGSDLRSLTLEAQIECSLRLAENAVFSDIRFRLEVSPPKFDVKLLGHLRAVLDNSELNFIGGLGIQATPRSVNAHMLAAMEGCWQNPFGASGVAIADIVLDLGIAFPPFTPTIAFTGALKVGTFTGMAAFKIDPTNPGSSMVAIAFNQLYLRDVFNAFCPPQVQAVIPAEIVNTVLNVGFEDVKIYIVPQTTQIGDVTFERGMALQGTMYLWGLRAFGSLKIDQTRGILVHGDVDPINIGGVFKLTGAGGRPNASLDLDLTTGAAPKIEIFGAVELLGIRSETSLQVSDKEFYLSTAGKIFDLFEASLEVRGGDLLKGESIYVKAAMQNDLITYLHDRAIEEIQAAANEATRQLSAAQQELTKAQNAVNSLQGEIDRAKARIDQLNQEIAAKQRWFDNSRWYEKAYRWAELSAYAAPRYAEIGALYAEIGSLEAAKHVAFGVLEAAKWVLEGIKATVGAAAQVGKFIVDFGLGGLLNIHYARFEGLLSATAGGRVSLAVGLTFMNCPQNFAFDFSFNDPLSGAKELADRLLHLLPAPA